jgi:hypothetical protein
LQITLQHKDICAVTLIKKMSVEADMSTNINLKEIERKAWRSMFQDGLWDIYLGLILFAMGMGALLEKLSLGSVQQYVVYIGLLILAMAVLWAGKRFITMPRMGRVKFGPQRKVRQNLVRFVLFGSVLFGVIVWIITSLVSGGWAAGLPWKTIFPAVYALNMLVVFGLAAYIFQFGRLYLIAVLYAFPVPVDFLVGQKWGLDLGYIAFSIPAVIIIAIGVTLLVRFVRENPVRDVPDDLD